MRPELIGYYRQEIKEIFDNKMINMIHTDDKKTIISQAYAIIADESSYFFP